MRVGTAPEGEDIARENWRKHEQETTPDALSGVQGQVDALVQKDQSFRQRGVQSAHKCSQAQAEIAEATATSLPECKVR